MAPLRSLVSPCSWRIVAARCGKNLVEPDTSERCCAQDHGAAERRAQAGAARVVWRHGMAWSPGQGPTALQQARCRRRTHASLFAGRVCASVWRRLLLQVKGNGPDAAGRCSTRPQQQSRPGGPWALESTYTKCCRRVYKLAVCPPPSTPALCNTAASAPCDACMQMLALT